MRRQTDRSGTLDRVLDAPAPWPAKALAVAVLLAVTLICSEAAPFTNGGFELPQIPTNSWRGLPIGDTSVTEWVVGGPSSGTIQENGFLASWSIGPLEGSQYVLFNVGSWSAGGTIAQTFDTQIGSNYVVSFNIGKEGVAAGTAQITATVTAGDGSTLATLSVSQTTTGWGPTNTLTFIASTAESTLTFEDTSPDTLTIDLALDNVSVEEWHAPSFRVLHSFTGGTVEPSGWTSVDGATPWGGVVLSGNTLYGTTYGGGEFMNGTVFQVGADGSGFDTLHSFSAWALGTNGDGAMPRVGVVLSGNTLYGTAGGGGTNAAGTVFKLNTDGTGFAVVHDFTWGADGGLPCGGLVVSGDALYGTASVDGSASWGIAFGLRTDGTGFTALHGFTGGTDGGEPAAGLALSGDTLYGTCCWGAQYLTNGTVFKVNTDGTGFATLHSFTGGADGGQPCACLVQSGNALYGTADVGGASGYGAVFKVNTDGTGFAVVHSFAGGSEGAPTGGLLLCGDTLYGTTDGGAADGGTVFKVSMDGTGYATLYSFSATSVSSPGTNSDGAWPNGDLILSGSTLYGTTYGGGSAGVGTVFALTLPQTTPIITWPSPAAITYGTALGPNQLNASASVPGTLTYSPPAGTVLSTGAWVLSVSFGPSDTVDYTAASNAVSILVLRAPLGVAADSATRSYGAATPVFTGTVSGLQNGDNIWATYGCGATPSSGTGTYPIVPTLADPNNRLGNYSVSATNGALTVAPAPLTVTVNDATRPYGATNRVFTGTVSGLQNGDDIRATYGCGATPSSGTGTYPIVPTLADPNNRLGNYRVSVTNGVLTVAPAPLTVTVNDATRPYGATNPPFTGSVVGLENGDNISAIYSCSATASSPPGTYSILAGLLDPGNRLRNYSVLTNDGTLTVLALYTVGATVFPAGGGLASGGGSYVIGSNVTVLAVPHSGYVFVDWTENGVQVSTSASYTFALAANLTLTANFTSLYAVAVNASPAWGGSTSGAGTYANGASALVTASTNSGCQFVAWTEGGAVVSVSPAYGFTVSGNRSLVANFAPYPFVPPKGSYSGLFCDQTNGVSQQSCGCFTITVAAKSGYSGSLQLGATKYALSGQFDGNGKASKRIPRRGLSLLTVALQLDLLSGADWVTGTVSNSAWTAELYGGRSAFDARTNVAPQAGSYTMVLPGVYGSTNEPGGDSWGTVTVSKAGAISVQGWLADGAALTPSGSVSKFGQWPFYASLYGGQGVLWGWLGFTNASDLGGPVVWIKQAIRGQSYPAGFTLTTDAVGLRYLPPGRGTNVLGLTVSTNLTLTLTGGGLARGITNRIALEANDTVKPLSNPKLTVTFTPATGVFSGSVPNPPASKAVSFKGVVLQGQGVGSGYFLGSSGSGEVQLGP